MLKELVTLAHRRRIALCFERLRRRGGLEAGFTLVELIIVMVLLIVVLTAISTSFVAGTKSESNFATRIQSQADARQALTDLRNDLHCSYAVQSIQQNPVSAGNPSGLGFSMALTEFYNTCVATVSSASGSSKVFLAWCTLPSSSNPSVFNLYRAKGTCDATGQLIASDIVAPAGGWPQNSTATDSTGTTTPSSWNGNIFPSTPTCQQGYLQTQNIDLAVNPDVTRAPNETYELKDQIALRNSTRCGTGTGSLATSTLSVSVAGAVFTGSPVTPSGVVSGSSNETSAISFFVFGPQATAPTTCTGAGASVGTASPAGDGTYASSLSFTPSAAGNYWWYASMPADSNNVAATSICGPGMPETVAVGSKASPTLAMSAPANGSIGTAIAGSSLVATLGASSGVVSGTITFKVFGPQASAPSPCTSGGTVVGTTFPGGNGAWSPSSGYTPPSAGTYWWYASFNGDTYDNAAASTCSGAMASTIVSKATPALVTAGPASGMIGVPIATSAISTTMSASSGATATGLITFKVFGPSATAPTVCTAGTTIGTAVTPAGNGTYHPNATFTPATAGTYWWYSSFAGDANDNATTSTCGGSMSSTVVALPDTFAVANPGAQTAGTAFNVTITAKLSGGATDTGYTGAQTIVFSGPANGPNGTAPVYPATVTFTNGVGIANITLYKAASTTLTATQAVITGTSTPFTVGSGTPAAFSFTNCSANGGAVTNPCGGTLSVGKNGFGTIHVSVLDAGGNPATVTGSALTVALNNAAPGQFSLTGTATIAVGATESSAVTATNLGNNNSSVITTTNAGFTQDSLTVQK